MGKKQVATKQKKKPADFKRPKRKVGRKAQPAANVTSVGITSRRINLLEQSVLVEKGDVVTHRHLTLQDLMQQIGHYNPHMRQRAIQGLRELGQSHTSNILANVSILLERFLPTFVDEEAVVRDTAISTWKVLVPVLVDGKSLQPFAKLIAVYFCSGLTHLQIGVRQDTLRAIGVLLDVAPELISVDAGLEQLGRLVENFRDLIAAVQSQGIKVTNSYDLLNSKKSTSGDSKSTGGGATSKSRKKKTSKTSSALVLRFAALKVLHKLLSTVNFSLTDDQLTPISQTQQNHRAARTSLLLTTPALLLYQTPTLVMSSQSGQLRNAGFWHEKSRSLVQSLLDLWLECLERDEDIDTLTEEYVEHMQYIVECATIILAANHEYLLTYPDSEFSKTVRRLIDQLLRNFPMFPSTNLAHEGDAYLSRWYGINVALAKFVCVILRLPANYFRTDQLDGQVVTFVIATFTKYRASDELRSLASTHAIIQSLLEVITLVLANVNTNITEGGDQKANLIKQEEILDSFTQFYTRCSSRSVTFRICTAFVVDQLQLLKTWPKWEMVLQWMTCFGKLLGHLESSHMELGRQCLLAMISVIKQLPAELSQGEAMDGIIANLVNFFQLSPPINEADGDENMTDSAQLTRFDDLRAQDQMDFVALVYHLPRYPVDLLRALASCCKSDRVHIDAKSFLMDILHQRSEVIDMAHLVSFLMSAVLARNTSQSQSTRSSAIESHLQQVHHTCRILKSMNLGSNLSKILGPSLSRQSASLDSMELLDLHTLVLLYHTCFASARTSKPDSEFVLEIPVNMEQDVAALSSKILLYRQQSTSAPELHLVEDLMVMLALCDNVFVPLINDFFRSAASKDDQGLSSTDFRTKRLRAIQLLVRSPCLNASFRRHQQQIASLAKELEIAFKNDLKLGVDKTVSVGVSNDAVRLVRQLQGDLELATAGN